MLNSVANSITGKCRRTSADIEKRKSPPPIRPIYARHNPTTCFVIVRIRTKSQSVRCCAEGPDVEPVMSQLWFPSNVMACVAFASQPRLLHIISCPYCCSSALPSVNVPATLAHPLELGIAVSQPVSALAGACCTHGQRGTKPRMAFSRQSTPWRAAHHFISFIKPPQPKVRRRKRGSGARAPTRRCLDTRPYPHGRSKSKSKPKILEGGGWTTGSTSTEQQSLGGCHLKSS
ncbi:hypothetical protein B0T19DRAFT_405781 [Cercophora scortea]|uniref:Uncharacterized protein n=1 Tax=Cercophora scortea TaxID=314031 RepID=A0AAE0MKM4_9PEZI|nr:hypothetical protein B0T19DRAFT_405781 [Cercophora scortea]